VLIQDALAGSLEGAQPLQEMSEEEPAPVDEEAAFVVNRVADPAT